MVETGAEQSSMLPSGDSTPRTSDKKEFRWGAQTSKSGYRYDELASAIQKCIRRGWEELAMFFAIDMVESGNVGYLWRRLTIMASEDIGIADPFAAVLVNALRSNAEVSRGAASKETLNDQLEPLAEVIMYLCRTKKSRVCDDFMCYVNRKRERGWKPEIPDVAIDMHTEAGRKKGRGELYFCQEGGVVSNEMKIDGPDYMAMYCEMCTSGTECMIKEKRKLGECQRS